MTAILGRTGNLVGFTTGRGTTPWNTEMEAALRKMDAMLASTVVAITNTLPGSANEGDLYLVGTSPTGVAAGWANRIARWRGSPAGWEAYQPMQGWIITIVGESTNKVRRYDGTAWVALAADTGAEPALPAGGAASDYLTGEKVWANFASVVRSVVLTGLSTASSAVVEATDTILQAIGKLQAQVALRLLKNNPAFTGTLTGPAATLSGRLIANGATPLSWGSQYKSVQFGLGSSVAVKNFSGGDTLYIFNNAYRDEANATRAISAEGNSSSLAIWETGELVYATVANPGAGAPASLAEAVRVSPDGALSLAGTVRVNAGGDGLFANIERVLFTDLGYQWTNNDERSIFANVTEARRRFSANAIVSGMQLRFESILQLGGWATTDDIQLFIGAPGGPTAYPNYLDIIVNRALPSSSALQRIEVDITFIGSGSSVVAYIRSRVSPLSSVSDVGIVYECGGTINVDNSVEREIDIRLNPAASMTMASKWNRVSISYPKS